jgi:hypothetical protein
MTDLSQFLARLATQPTGTRLAQYQTLFNTLSATGDLAHLDVLQIWDAIDTPTALTNLISSKYTGVVHGGMTFAANAGFTGDGSTGYIDTQFNPSTAVGAKYSLNSASMGLYSTVAAPGAASVMGASDAATVSFSFVINYATNGSYNQYSSCINDASFNMAGPALYGNSKGALAACRTGVAAEASYWDGSLISTASAGPTAVPTKTVLVGALNDIGSIDNFGTAQISAFFIGDGQLNIANVTNAINAFLTVDGLNAYPIALNSGAMSFISAPALPVFGINSHTTIGNLGVTPIPVASTISMLEYLGCTALRLDCVTWEVIEASLGVYTYTIPDAYLPALTAASYNVDVTCSYSNTLYENSFFTLPTDTTGINAFKAAYAGVATRYGPTNMTYEIWNEENISNGPGQYSAAPAANAANYATLFDATTAAIIGALPRAKIISGGVAPGGGSGFIAPDTFVASFLADTAQAAHLTAVGFHPYSGGLPSSQTPEYVEVLWSSFKTAAGAHPIAANEFGFYTAECNGSETLKAVFNVREMIWLIIQGAAVIQPYVLVQDQDFYGYFDASFNPLPSAVAYKALIAAFSGAISIRCFGISYHGNPAFPEFIMVVIEKSATSFTIIAYPTIGTFNFTFAVGANVVTCQARDLFGNAVSVSNDGAGNLTFATAPLTGPVILTFGYGYITDTTILELPINCVLDGQQDYEIGESEIEAHPTNVRLGKVIASSDGLRRLSDNPPSFVVKTNKRSYD